MRRGQIWTENVGEVEIGLTIQIQHGLVLCLWPCQLWLLSEVGRRSVSSDYKHRLPRLRRDSDDEDDDRDAGEAGV